MDMKDICDIPGKMWDYHSLSGTVVKTSQFTLVDSSIWPFGCFALIGDMFCSDMSWVGGIIL